MGAEVNEPLDSVESKSENACLEARKTQSSPFRFLKEDLFFLSSVVYWIRRNRQGCSGVHLGHFREGRERPNSDILEAAS